jgi:hypothetical protein
LNDFNLAFWGKICNMRNPMIWCTNNQERCFPSKWNASQTEATVRMWKPFAAVFAQRLLALRTFSTRREGVANWTTLEIFSHLKSAFVQTIGNSTCFLGTQINPN